MQEPRKQRMKRAGKQWLWFVGIYVASVIVVAGVVYLLRWMIGL